MTRNADDKPSPKIRIKKAAMNPDYLGSWLFGPQQ
jgi:hypothetical protein